MAEALQTHSSSSDRRIALLGKGGFGEVELIVRREGRFQRLYARKRLLPAHQQDVELRSMFFEEARLAGMIRHPNVVSVLDVGADQQGPFLLLDYVDGVSVQRIIENARAKEQPIPLQVCLRIAMQVADGLHAAHELTDHQARPLGLVHRDVSPANILVGYDGVARVSDFGVARALGRTTHTATGFLKGKFGYMSPEQLRFEEPDRRSDLFALGVVLFELISARRLYANQDGMDGARRALNEPPPDLADHRDDVPEALVQLLFSMLAKQPAHRPEAAKWVSNRLEAILAALAAEEGRIDVADYLEEEFGAERRHQQAELARWLAAPPATDPAPGRDRRVWPWLVPAIAVALGLVYLVLPSSAPPPPPAAPAAAQSEAPTVEPQPASPAPNEASTLAPADEVDPPESKSTPKKKRSARNKTPPAKGVPMWGW